MKNKILITLNNLDDYNKYKELGIEKFLVPLKGFSVGYPNTFLIDEINFPAYIYINRILDNEGIDELKKVLGNINDNIKGIVFDDLGVLQIIKDLKIEKILYLSHFNCNSKSVGIYLDYVDSVILSTDITKEEIEYIVNNYGDKVTLFTLGYTQVMYSRRLLINNYCDYYTIPRENPIVIDNEGKKFILYENEYGTVFYYQKLFNGLELFNLDVKYYFINSVFLTFDEVKNYIEGKDNSNIESDKGFLYTKTIYKLKEDNNE